MPNFYKNKQKKRMFPFFFYIIIALIFLYNVSPAGAIKSEIDWPNIPGVSKQIAVNGELNPDFGLPDLVKYIFNFFIMIGGLAAFSMIVWGGFSWLTSAGNPTQTKEAKDRITSALLGLLLLLTSWLLLNLINPDVLILKSFSI